MRATQTKVRAPRRSVHFSCQVVREKTFHLVADRAVNLSRSGLLVMPADPALTGEPLLMSFRIPGTTYWLDAEAYVARVLHGRRAGEHTRALALQFEAADPRSLRLLEYALDELPLAPPGSRPGRRGVISIRELLRGAFGSRRSAPRSYAA